MRAIFCLPAHPSYFDDDYSQAEIDRAIERYDKETGGMISRGNPHPKIRHEFLLLREPGKAIAVIFHSEGFGDGKRVPEYAKDHAVAQYRSTSSKDLETHVNNIKNLLKYLRDNPTSSRI